MVTAIKHPLPDRGKPVICNFWHPGTLTLMTERQSARMSKITNDVLTRDGTGCFIAVTIWQQWASKGFNHTHNTSSSSSSSNRLFFLALAVVVTTVAAAGVVMVGLVMDPTAGFDLCLVLVRPRSKSSQSSIDSGRVTFRPAAPTAFDSPTA